RSETAVSRKRKGAPFSLFAFQDAITSVCGVVVLITLMLALELTRRVADDTPEQNDPVAAQVKELRAKIAAEREDIEALESAAPDAGDAVDPQTAGFSLAEVQTNFENVQKRLEAAKAEEARLRNEREAARATERANADEEKRLAELREELKKVREEAQSATDAPSAPDNPNLVYYEFPDGVREKPWYVDISGGNIVAVPSDPDETRREFASPEEFVAWAKTRSRVNEYFVLIARPSGAAKFDAISLELEDLHFKLGIDLVAEKRELQFIPPRKKGARR
ncbi:MAG: hypothetical protein II596_11580, partial [Thermoguttaceae bacterium]|nr:hypothetical protein [Thermoguttaceae bacterium]